PEGWDMSFEEMLTLAIPASYLVLLAVELAWPARQFSRQPHGKLTGGLFFLMMGAVAALVPLALPAALLERIRLFDLSGLGVSGGVIVGVLAWSFVAYWWHRAEHRFDVLWRGFHQLHHSPQRVDLYRFVFI